MNTEPGLRPSTSMSLSQGSGAVTVTFRKGGKRTVKLRAVMPAGARAAQASERLKVR